MFISVNLVDGSNLNISSDRIVSFREHTTNPKLSVIKYMGIKNDLIVKESVEEIYFMLQNLRVMLQNPKVLLG